MLGWRLTSHHPKSSDYGCAGLSVDLLDDGPRRRQIAPIISAALAISSDHLVGPILKTVMFPALLPDTVRVLTEAPDKCAPNYCYAEIRNIRRVIFRALVIPRNTSTIGSVILLQKSVFARQHPNKRSY